MFPAKYLQTVSLFWLPATQNDNVSWSTPLCKRASLSGKRQQSCWDKAQILSSKHLHHQHYQFFEQHNTTCRHYIKRSIVKWSFARWAGSNARLRIQYREHGQPLNKQSVLEYRCMQQIEHLHVFESILSCKDQRTLDAQFYPNVLGNLYSQDI